jgi:drug/metabolite transporter (DMT)-like permease
MLRATVIGSSAIAMWATLALLTSSTGAVPPLQLTAMAFLLAAVIGMVFRSTRRSHATSLSDIPWPAWALGVGGLFGYHFFYFMALRHAPVVEASLIAYLWPLLISGGRSLSFGREYALGYLAALVCAFTWSTYSVLSRRSGELHTSVVGFFCAATAALAWLAHLLMESTVWPTGWQWGAVVALGLGPVGLAFFAWDYGVKHGNITTLGALSYLAPLLSTVLLIIAGRAMLSWNIGVACLLIVAGAALASGVLHAVLRRRRISDENPAEEPR